MLRTTIVDKLCHTRVICELVTWYRVRASTQHVRIVFPLVIAFSILRGYLAFASVKMPPKKRKGRVRFRHRNREGKRNRRASLTKNGQQNWQRATKAHFISKQAWSAREVARGVGYSEKRKCCSCWECKPLQNPAVENNKRSSYRIERKAAWETGRVCILSIAREESKSWKM